MAYIYQNSAWAAYDSKKYDVNTTTFTTYPFTIKSPTTPVNITIYGNMQQTGTPTPTNPIQPNECGDLETTGEHTGQYKIPILSNSTTTPVYLGEVQSTRRIKKLVLTGDETWNIGTTSMVLYLAVNDYLKEQGIICCCSHYKAVTNVSSADNVNNGECAFNYNLNWLYIKDENISTAASFKLYLQQQYANNKPVTVWYVLAEPTTGIVNEPLRKIGDYADTVATSIPVTINSDTVDINTTLKPSAVAAPSLSWGTGDDYKRSGGIWS